MKKHEKSNYRIMEFEVYANSSIAKNANDADRTAAIPEVITLAQNYPNPFNPVTTILYGLPRTSHVTLKVYDVLGRVVTVLVDETQGAGEKSVIWDAREMSSGVYFYRMHAISLADPTRSFTQVKKLLFLK